MLFLLAACIYSCCVKIEGVGCFLLLITSHNDEKYQPERAITALRGLLAAVWVGDGHPRGSRGIVDVSDIRGLGVG